MCSEQWEPNFGLCVLNPCKFLVCFWKAVPYSTSIDLCVDHLFITELVPTPTSKEDYMIAALNKAHVVFMPRVKGRSEKCTVEWCPDAETLSSCWDSVMSEDKLSGLCENDRVAFSPFLSLSSAYGERCTMKDAEPDMLSKSDQRAALRSTNLRAAGNGGSCWKELPSGVTAAVSWLTSDSLPKALSTVTLWQDSHSHS